MQVLDPKFSKMTAPNFGPNSLCGPSTVLKEGGQTKGGPQKPPQEDRSCSSEPPLKLEMAIC